MKEAIIEAKNLSKGQSKIRSISAMAMDRRITLPIGWDMKRRWKSLNRKELAVYFIMGTENCKSEHPLEVLKDALQAGITFFN